jgi:hypothetical protein
VAGPVTSPYPGTPAMVVLAALFLTIFVRSIRSAYRRRRKGTGFDEYGTDIAVGLVGAILFVMALWAIWVWVHR